MFDAQGRPNPVALEDHYRHNPYHFLWLAVLIRAVHDLVNENMSCARYTKTRSGKLGHDQWERHRTSAEWFLFDDEESLAAICDAIGFDMEWVRQIAKRRLDNVPIFRPRAATRIK